VSLCDKIMAESSIVFFDGVCGLCNRFVDYVIVADRKNKYVFAPLQGHTFQKLVANQNLEFPDSVVLYSDGKFITRSTAALLILKGLGGGYIFVCVFLIIPKFIRDFVYGFIAKNRYKWFGQKETCRLPSTEEGKRFLD